MLGNINFDFEYCGHSGARLLFLQTNNKYDEGIEGILYYFNNKYCTRLQNFTEITR